jgi:hypothetical protein
MLLTSRDVGKFHPQRTFDRIVEHQRRQGYKQSTREVKRADGTVEILCAYQGDNGCQCAAMAVIPPHLYCDALEDHTINFGLLKWIVEKEGHSHTLVFDLQVIHDTVTPDAWEQAWAGIAQKHGLKYSPPVAEKILENSAPTY